jgi:glyoxylase-like metal-dependent hydrolase (beta-lactamase superfamily II)
MMLRSSQHGPVTRFDLARTLAGRGRYWTTAYLVDDLMVDTGCAHAAPELLATLAGRHLETVVNTHPHEDHIGADGPLQRRHRAVVRAHPLAVPVIADPVGEQPLHPYRRVLWGWPEPAAAVALADGEEVATASHRFRVVFTPGHSGDHLCLHEPERGWLFTGDLYVGGRDRAITAGADVWAVIASLKRVAALAPTTLFPGSARIPEFAGPALAAKIDHLEELGGRVLDLHRAGAGVGEIVARLLGPPMWIELVTHGHFSRPRLPRLRSHRRVSPAPAPG